MSTTVADEAARSLADEVRDWVVEAWSHDITVREWWRRLFDAGLARPMLPVGLGGRGLAQAQARIVEQVLADAGTIGPPTGNVAAGLATPTILRHGTPDQIQRFVPAIGRGEAAWCQLFSEPGAGSDLAGIGTRAVLDGDEWVVTGQKVWNSSADISQYGLLLARTDTEVPKHAGMSYFLIAMDQPGVEVRPLKQMNGMSSFCEVFLTEARVPADCLLGQLGDGWTITQTTLAAERSNISSRVAPGLYAAASGPKGDLDLTTGAVIARVRATRRSKIPAGAVPSRLMIEMAKEHGVTHDPVMRQRLARYYSQTKIDGWTVRRIAAAKGRLTGADGSMTKLATARICQVSRDLSFAIVGAQAMLQGADAPLEGDLHRVGLGSPGNRLGGGTDEIQLNVMGERGLGLPREPDSDRDVPYKDLKVGTQSR